MFGWVRDRASDHWQEHKHTHFANFRKIFSFGFVLGGLIGLYDGYKQPKDTTMETAAWRGAQEPTRLVLSGMNSIVEGTANAVNNDASKAPTGVGTIITVVGDVGEFFVAIPVALGTGIGGGVGAAVGNFVRVDAPSPGMPSAAQPLNSAAVPMNTTPQAPSSPARPKQKVDPYCTDVASASCQ